MTRVRLTRRALRDLRLLLDWSREHFGQAAAGRYENLMKRALDDLAADPHRPGVKDISSVRDGYFLYHLWWSRAGSGVGRPRHFIAFVITPSLDVEVRAILHERQALHSHLG